MNVVEWAAFAFQVIGVASVIMWATIFWAILTE